MTEHKMPEVGDSIEVRLRANGMWRVVEVDRIIGQLIIYRQGVIIYPEGIYADRHNAPKGLAWRFRNDGK